MRKVLLSTRFHNFASILAALLALLYIASMFVLPWVSGDGSWKYVQSVWSTWQAFNVGMLAFISSVLAFSISRFNAEKQRKRNFLASRAFLPAALSELVSYFKDSATVFNQWWEARNGVKLSSAPALPQEYKPVFQDCIRHAEPRVGDYLSNILVWLQVHDARMRDAVTEKGEGPRMLLDKYNLISYYYRLGELQVFVNKLFDFSRGMKDFDTSTPEWDDFKNAYHNLNIWPENIHIDENMNLEAFTKRRLSKLSVENT